MTDVEIVALAMIAPLGHDPAADWSRVYVGNGMENDGSLKALCYDLAAAALSAATPAIEARVRAECAVIAYAEADCGGPDVCRVQRLRDGSCLNGISGDCGRDNAESVAAAIRKG